MNHSKVNFFVFLIQTRIFLFCALMTLVMMPNMITGESNVPAVAQSTATNHLATTARNQANKSEHQRFRISGEIAYEYEMDSTTTPTPTQEFKDEKRKRTVKDKRKAKNN